MAKAAAKAGKAPAAAAPRKRGGMGGKILGFLLLALGFTMLPTSSILVLGMFPTVVSYLTDRDRRKTAATSVGAMNICGVLPFEFNLWSGENSMAHAGAMLRDPFTWVSMWGAAMIGSIIYYSVPSVIGAFLAHRSAARVAELERRQTALREAWGGEVSGRSSP